MRWEEMLLDLFDDLEQQAEGLALAERDSEVAELSRAEYAQVDLASRLHASTGRQLGLVVAGLGSLEATLLRAGAGWLLARDQRAEWIVRTGAVTRLHGVSEQALAEPHRPLPSRVGLGAALRSVAESRAAVVLHDVAGASLRGQLGRVGADFVELWVAPDGAGWSPGPAGRVEVLPFAAVAAVRRT